MSDQESPRFNENTAQQQQQQHGSLNEVSAPSPPHSPALISFGSPNPSNIRASTVSTASARERGQQLQAQFDWIDVDVDLALSPPAPAFHQASSISQQHARSVSSSSTSSSSVHLARPPRSSSSTSIGLQQQQQQQRRQSSSRGSNLTIVPPPAADITASDMTYDYADDSDLPYAPPSPAFAPRSSSLGREQEEFPDPATVPLASLVDAPDSPELYQDARVQQQQQASSSSYPSPPSPAFHPYDTPSSPGLPPSSSPYLSSSSFAHHAPPYRSSSPSPSAALIPLPTSPYDTSFPPSPSLRGQSLQAGGGGGGSVPPYGHTYDSRVSTSSFAGPSDHRGSYYTDVHSASNGYGYGNSDASSTRRLVYPSGTPSPSNYYPNSVRGGSPAPGYFDAPAGGPHSAQGTPRLAALAGNESSVWGDEDADEKGFYGALDRGMGMEETQQAVDEKGYSSAKRWKAAAYAGEGRGKGKGKGKPGKQWSRKRWILTGLGLIALIAAGAVAALIVLKKEQSSSDAGDSSSSSDSSGSGDSQTKTSSTGSATWGADGSTITMANGTKFTYSNQFGGYWASGAFNNSAKAQSYTPSLDEEWDFSTDKIYGVNIGGWLTLEPFITPALYEQFLDASTPAVDEWTLSTNLGQDLESTLTDHYDTFITEQDFAQIAGAGLNWVRISLPYWAIETYEVEPFLEGVAWSYFLKAIEWARKYGLRINLDYHALPGSQNGWNHSGRLGTVNFMNGVMGIANAQRSINYIRALTEFISQPEIAPVVPMFGIVNEAWVPTIGLPAIRSFYYEVYTMMREISGTGTGKGPMVSIHDGFQGSLTPWAGFLSGSDRIALDSHPYLAFTDMNNDPMSLQIPKPCDENAAEFNTSMSDFGFTYAGEWSLGVNDCGQFLNGVGNGTRFEGTYKDGSATENITYGNCDAWTDISNFNATLKAELIDLAYTNMDSFQNWFFWTWKVAASTVLGHVASPMWCYSCGLANGYIPTDPRGSRGACFSMATKYDNAAPSSVPFDGSLAAWMTGGSGAGTIAATQVASYSQWPPTSIANAPSTSSLNPASLYTMTSTGLALALTASPTPTSQSYQSPVLTVPYAATVSGCDYPDAWLGAGMAQPTAAPC